MMPKTKRVQRALSRVVELRSIGKAWEEIAKLVKREVDTLKSWPKRYADYWQRLQRATSDWIKSANLLIRLLIERQKIDLRAMQAGLLRPNPSESDGMGGGKIKWTSANGYRIIASLRRPSFGQTQSLPRRATLPYVN